jgi:hypothetical protein
MLKARADRVLRTAKERLGAGSSQRRQVDTDGAPDVAAEGTVDEQR